MNTIQKRCEIPFCDCLRQKGPPHVDPRELNLELLSGHGWQNGTRQGGNVMESLAASVYDLSRSNISPNSSWTRIRAMTSALRPTGVARYTRRVRPLRDVACDRR